MCLELDQDGYEVPADATVHLRLRFRGDDQDVDHPIDLEDARRLADALAELVAAASN